MSTGLVVAIKKAALDAIENSQMCDFRYGEVINVSPIKVKTTNNLIIPSSLLVVPEHLTDRAIEMVIDDEVKTVIINESLKLGDNVVLLRKQGGQSYFILDRI